MQNILVSMLVNVGDVIMMTSALDLMRQKIASCRITALIRPEAQDLMAANPSADEVIIYPYKSGSPFYGLPALQKRLKAASFDCFLSLDRRPRGISAAFLAGIGTRIGPNILYCGSKEKPLLNILFNKIVKLSSDECCASQVKMFQLVAKRAFNIEGEGHITLPPVAKEKQAWVKELFHNAKGPVVGLCIRTNDPRKLWGKENFSALIKRLQSDFNAFIYITGGSADRFYVEELQQHLAGSPVLNLAGKTEFMDIQALASQSCLCIGLDNGAGHLIANSGLKNFICILKGTSAGFIIDSMPQAHFFSFPPNNDETGQESYSAKQVDLVYEKAANILANP